MPLQVLTKEKSKAEKSMFVSIRIIIPYSSLHIG